MLSCFCKEWLNLPGHILVYHVLSDQLSLVKWCECGHLSGGHPHKELLYLNQQNNMLYHQNVIVIQAQRSRLFPNLFVCWFVSIKATMACYCPTSSKIMTVK